MLTADRSKGFTLVEVVITVAIIGVLAMMAVPLLEMTAKRQKEAELRAALRQIRTAIDAYHDMYTAKPARIEQIEGASGYPPDLESLAKGVPDITHPERRAMYFLRRLPRDPMSTEPDATPAETWGKRSYASTPDEPQEGEDVFDVYSKSPGVGLNGVPYREW